MKEFIKFLEEFYCVVNVLLKNYKASILVIHQNMNIWEQFKI